uniref:Uncharacterized protein n=1 Tax=Tanacetum cinerariifolium TaxID=118510 RepID=A0A6L2N6R9_TANCI|nr:hypothetical protein [Tanacetum cinerariifolium]
MYPRFLQLINRKQVGDLSTHTTKYTSPALTQKVFANIRRVGKGFSGVETPLFEGMLEEQEIDEEGDAAEHVEEVNTGDSAEGDDSAAHKEVPTSAAHKKVPTVAEEQSIPSLTPPTPPPQPPQDIPSTSQRVETSDDTVMDDESNQGRMIAKIDQDDAVFLEDDKEKDKDVADAVKDVEKAKKLLLLLVKPLLLAEAQVLTAITATLIAAPVRVAAAPSRKEPKPLKKKQQIEHDEQYARELHAELNKDIEWDEAIDDVKLKAKEDPAVKRYQAMKRKPQTKAQARKNMMMYLKNIAGFKLDYFKGMSCDDIRPIFEVKFNSNVAFLLNTKKQIEEDENRALQTINETPAERAAKMRKLDEEVEDLKRHLQIVPNEDDDVYTEATPLAKKVPVVDYEIIEMNNKPYYKIIRADGTHQLYISFLTLLRNFDIEDLEDLWSLVKERFSTAKPKNFFDDFLLTTLGAMFKKPNTHAQIWKNQRSVHGQAKVKSWKLLASCGVLIITFTTTQLILLVERRYLLSRFTLDQMLNAVRLQVEEESEVSLK